MVRRYWLFAGHSYYPHGGMRDYIDSFDSIDDAVKAFKDYNSSEDMEGIELDWCEVMDTESMKVVKSAGSPCYPDYRNFSVIKGVEQC